MSSVVKIVKRKDREGVNTSRRAEDSPPVSAGTSSIATKVKTWIAVTRERRRVEADFASQLKRGLEVRKNAYSQTLIPALKRASGCAKRYRTSLPALGLIFLLAHSTGHAQGTAPASGESFTLDQAIALALRDNHGMKIAGLAVERAEEDVSALGRSSIMRLPTATATGDRVCGGTGLHLVAFMKLMKIYFNENAPPPTK